MSYSSWVKSHGEKHNRIMEKLKDLSDDEVIEYFRFENMVEKEPDFCPLYKKSKKCHDIENLNCICVHVQTLDLVIVALGRLMEGLYIVSVSGFRRWERGSLTKGIHQDCSLCLIPHSEEFIRDVLEEIGLRYLLDFSYNLSQITSFKLVL